MTQRRRGRTFLAVAVGATLVGALLAGGRPPSASAGSQLSTDGVPADGVPAAGRDGLAARVSTAPPHYPVGAYITAVYNDLFERDPDPTGLAGWTWALTHGTPYGAVADGITYSNEFRRRLITEAYRTYLGRTPDAAGLSGWLGAMQRGVQIQHMEAGFLASDEYYRAAGGTAAGWITALYADVLGRAPSGADVSAWSAAIPRQGRYTVAASFLYSTEKLEADVGGYYLWLLHRPLDAVGRAGWVRAIQAGHRVEEIIAGIIASPEYRQNVPSITPPGPGQDYATGPMAPLDFDLFPASNAWNTPVDGAAVDPASATLIASIGASDRLHMDFGADWDGGPFGIPYVVVGANQTWFPVTFGYADESDPGPYPIPPDAPIEGGPNADGDRHVLVVDASTHMLYELYDAHPRRDGSWYAGSGAVFDLDTGTTRPAGWTSADAAGLPILPGLVRYDEVAAGHIDHALRFTVGQTRRAYVAPATHFASSSSSTSLPPMGMRVRLRADYDISGYPAQARVILEAMQTYGMIVADNGSDWYVSGAPDARWDDDQLNTLKGVPGSAFEVVAMGPVTTG
jgi:hypothetical protein